MHVCAVGFETGHCKLVLLTIFVPAHPVSLHTSVSFHPASPRDMGNVNEKNTSTDEEKDVCRSLLESVPHLDPKTVCMQHFIPFLLLTESNNTLGRNG
jgi:hypothetical protein